MDPFILLQPSPIAAGYLPLSLLAALVLSRTTLRRLLTAYDYQVAQHLLQNQAAASPKKILRARDGQTASREGEGGAEGNKRAMQRAEITLGAQRDEFSSQGTQQGVGSKDSPSTRCWHLAPAAINLELPRTNISPLGRTLAKAELLLCCTP